MVMMGKGQRVLGCRGAGHGAAAAPLAAVCPLVRCKGKGEARDLLAAWHRQHGSGLHGGRAQACCNAYGSSLPSFFWYRQGRDLSKHMAWQGLERHFRLARLGSRRHGTGRWRRSTMAPLCGSVRHAGTRSHSVKYTLWVKVETVGTGLLLRLRQQAGASG